MGSDPAITALFAATLVAHDMALPVGSLALLDGETSAAKPRKSALGRVVSIGMSRSYLDAVSGQPMHPQARAVLDGFADRAWADPDLPHHEGRVAAQIRQAARETVAAALKVPPQTVSFHPSIGLAELAIGGAICARQTAGYKNPPVVLSQVERSTVRHAATGVSDSHEVTQVSVQATGALRVEEFRDAITERENLGVVAAVQAANTELATAQPLAEVIEICRGKQVPLVTDATGTLGLRPVADGWSILFADALTWAGPVGVGILVVADPAAWRNPFSAPGADASTTPADTADVLQSAGAAAALDAVAREMPEVANNLRGLVARIRREVPRAIPDVDVLGDPEDRLPHIVTFSCLYADGERLASELDRRGIAVGSGSACASSVGLPSHVLAAVGALTHGNVRVSLPLTATDADVDHLLAELPAAVAAVRSDAGIQ